MNLFIWLNESILGQNHKTGLFDNSPPARSVKTLTRCIHSHFHRITLTLLSLPPCRPSSIRNPQCSPPHSQTTSTRPLSSRTTSLLCNLKSAQSAHWSARRSMPCAFSSYSARLDIECSISPRLTEIRVYQQGCLPARVEPRTCSWYDPFPCFPFPIIPDSIGDLHRESCCIEAESSGAQRAVVYYRRWLATSFATRSHRASHRGAARRTGQ
jgi:hypothetical protein